jgi:hypothetical protein
MRPAAFHDDRGLGATSGWLKIDPTFDALRQHPRFQRLVGEKT